MKNLDIVFSGGRASLSREVYEEIRAFLSMHGETDLPVFVDEGRGKTVKADAAVLDKNKDR